MSDDSFKYLSSYLAEALAGGEALPAALQTTRRLQQAWEAAAPAAVRDHARPLNYNDGTLVLGADSSVRATTLRYRQRGLIQQLRAHPAFADLAALRIRVLPPETPSKPAANTPAPPLSAKTGRLLEATADGINDPRLRAAIRKLARRAGR
jgi:hypothetical protein